MRLRQLVIALVVLAGGAAVLAPVGAQTKSTWRPDRPGWFTRQVELDDPPAADRAVMERNLAAAEALISRTSGYAAPRGFEAAPFWRSQPVDHGPLWTYWVDIAVAEPTFAANSGAYITLATIVFNPDLGYLSDGAVKSEGGEYYYLERPRSDSIHGETLAYGQFGPANSSLTAVFTAHDQLPMVPVSREEYLRALIFGADDYLGSSTEVATGTKTPYQEWLEGAAQRKQEREQMIANMTDKAMAESLRANLEQIERQMTETMKQADGQGVRPLPVMLRRQLDAMTPGERASQAWAAGTELVPAGAPGGRVVVKSDPTFYRPRSSAADARAIAVIMREPPRGFPTGRAQEQWYREFNWNAVRQLLDTAP